jgi:hypothetical protein
VTVDHLGVDHGDEMLPPVRFFLTLTDSFVANRKSRSERSFISIYDRLAAVAVSSDNTLRDRSQLQSSHSNTKAFTDQTNPFQEGHWLSAASQLSSAQPVVQALLAK